MNKDKLDKGLLKTIEMKATKRNMSVDDYLSTSNTRYTLLDSGSPVLIGFTATSYAVFETVDDALKFRESYGKDTATILTEDVMIERLAVSREPIFTTQEAAVLYSKRGTVKTEGETVILTY